jgi:hypothetical protein
MGLYKEEERGGADRRRGERRREERGGADRRRGERRRGERGRGKEKRRRTLFWLLIIALVSLVFGALTVNIPVVIEKFFNYKDESYRPMDLDRIRHELEKAKPVDKK